MAEISIPKSHADLPISPSLPGVLPISERVQQVFALLVGSTQEATQFLKLANSGAVCTTSMRIQDIIHKTAAGSPANMTGDDLPCTEVMCLGHPSNTGTVWIRADKTATANNAWPLAKGEAVIFTIDNLKQLNFLMTVGSEKLIIAYTR